MLILFLYFSILLISFAVYNAYFVLEITGSKEKRDFYSHVWHTIGLAMRIYIWAAVPLIILLKQNIILSGVESSIKWTILFILFGGFAYDIIINTIRYLYEGAPKLTYVDYKNWNKFFVDKIFFLILLYGNIFKNRLDKNVALELAKNIYFWTRIAFVIIILILLLI